MKIQDYESIVLLWQQTEGLKVRDADSREGTEKYLSRNPGLSFVAEEDGIVIGTIMAGHDGRRGYIQHLTVKNDNRKNGIATELLSRCISALKSEGILKSHVHVLTNNLLAKDFWVNRGWQKRDDIEVYSFINGANENI